MDSPPPSGALDQGSHPVTPNTITSNTSESSPSIAPLPTTPMKRGASDNEDGGAANKKLVIRSGIFHSPRKIQKQLEKEKKQEIDLIEREERPKVLQPSLDNLPTELIQQIFTYRTNLQLPLVNSLLYKALNTEFVKAKLLTDLFSWVQNRQGKWELEADRHWKVFNRDERYQHDMNPHRIEQQALLCKPWVTYELLRKCQWQHLLKHGVGALREFLGPMGDCATRDLAILQLRRNMRSNFEWGKFSDSYVYRSRPKRWVKGRDYIARSLFWMDRGDGMIFQAFMPDDLGFNTMLVIRTYNNASDDSEAVPVDLTIAIFPALAYEIEIPTRLVNKLHLQPNAMLFKTVVEASGWSFDGVVAKPWAYFQDPESARKACDEELSRAIRMWHAPVAQLILGSPRSSASAKSRSDAFKEDALRLNPAKRLLLGPTPGSGYQKVRFQRELRLDYWDVWRGINESTKPAWERIEHRKLVQEHHLELILREGPVGKMGWSWYHWLGAHDHYEIEDLRAIAARTLTTVIDPARYEFVEALASADSKYVFKTEYVE